MASRLDSPRRHSPSLALAAFAVFALPSAVSAQTGSQPAAPKPAPPCSAADAAAGKCTAAPAPSAKQQFPYPGDHPGTADPDDPIAPAAASAPHAPPSTKPASTPGAGPGAGKQFPYPGEADPNAGSSSSSSGSSSSSSSGSSSSSAADPDDPLDTPSATAAPTGRRKLPKPTHLQSDDEREAEDIKVAKFYRDDGNALAAYNRVRDAVKLITDDADAWFLLGEVATKLHKTDEAADAYRKFLALEPNTRRAKALAHTQPELTAKQ